MLKVPKLTKFNLTAKVDLNFLERFLWNKKLIFCCILSREMLKFELQNNKDYIC